MLLNGISFVFFACIVVGQLHNLLRIANVSQRRHIGHDLSFPLGLDLVYIFMLGLLRGLLRFLFAVRGGSLIYIHSITCVENAFENVLLG